MLIAKAIDACAEHDVPRLVLGGGVAANSRVRALAEERAGLAGVDLRIPPLSLCTDNGAMIAVLGAELIKRGQAPSRMDTSAQSTVSAEHAQLGRDVGDSADVGGVPADDAEVTESLTRWAPTDGLSAPEEEDAEGVDSASTGSEAEGENEERIDEAITGLQPTVSASTTRAPTPKRPWLPTVSLSLGVLGLALSPVLGVGVIPAILAVVTGHISKPHPLARKGTVMVALVLGYLGIALSIVVGVVAATPLVRALLVSAGLLLPEG